MGNAVKEMHSDRMARARLRTAPHRPLCSGDGGHQSRGGMEPVSGLYSNLPEIRIRGRPKNPRPGGYLSLRICIRRSRIDMKAGGFGLDYCAAASLGVKTGRTLGKAPSQWTSGPVVKDPSIVQKFILTPSLARWLWCQ